MDGNDIQVADVELMARCMRRRILDMSLRCEGPTHLGGGLSIVEIMASLYGGVMKYRPSEPNWPDRDRFILSKGHACWVYYVLLREKNFNPVLEGHPHLDLLNGVHWTTGSEGHGFPAGLGMAFAKKKKKEPGLVYVLMGDGECQEGTTWESLLLASHLKLDNLVIIVDYNKIQGSGYVEDILPMESVLTLAKSLNWEVKEVNGHDLDDIENTIKNMNEPNKPKFVFAHTVKGKGVSYMENEPAWHAKWPDPEHEKIAIEELSK